MDKLDDAIRTVRELDEADDQSPLAKVHPLAKLVTALVFAVLVTSVPKYRLDLCFAMGVWLYGYAVFFRLSPGECFRRLWGLFLLLFFVGIANPILDRKVLFMMGRVSVTSGMISMLSLFLKGALTLFSAWFLAVSCGMLNILSALKAVHVPQVLLNVIYLIYRYLTLLLEEASRVFTAYRLRAPGQRGLHFSVWGSLVGSMLLRSMARAETVYQSMELRGYQPEYAFTDSTPWNGTSSLYLILCLISMALLRFIPIFSFLGSLVMN